MVTSFFFFGSWSGSVGGCTDLPPCDRRTGLVDRWRDGPGLLLGGPIDVRMDAIFTFFFLFFGCDGGTVTFGGVDA